MTKLDILTRHYLRAALWSSTDDNGEPLDAHCTLADIATSALEQARTECAEFIAQAGAIIDTLPDTYGAHPDCGNVFPTYAAAGHDFWLTRNGHGAGFWDRDLGNSGDQLTRVAESMGTRDCYIGDDAFIYFA